MRDILSPFFELKPIEMSAFPSGLCTTVPPMRSDTFRPTESHQKVIVPLMLMQTALLFTTLFGADGNV